MFRVRVHYNEASPKSRSPHAPRPDAGCCCVVHMKFTGFDALTAEQENRFTGQGARRLAAGVRRRRQVARQEQDEEARPEHF